MDGSDSFKMWVHQTRVECKPHIDILVAFPLSESIFSACSKPDFELIFWDCSIQLTLFFGYSIRAFIVYYYILRERKSGPGIIKGELVLKFEKMRLQSILGYVACGDGVDWRVGIFSAFMSFC